MAERLENVGLAALRSTTAKPRSRQPLIQSPHREGPIIGSVSAQVITNSPPKVGGMALNQYWKNHDYVKTLQRTVWMASPSILRQAALSWRLTSSPRKWLHPKNRDPDPLPSFLTSSLIRRGPFSSFPLAIRQLSNQSSRPSSCFSSTDLIFLFRSTHSSLLRTFICTQHPYCTR